MLAPAFRRLTVAASLAVALALIRPGFPAAPVVPAGACPPYPTCQAIQEPYYCCSGTYLVCWGLANGQYQYCLEPHACTTN